MQPNDFKDFKTVSSSTINVLNRKDNLGDKLRFKSTRVWKFMKGNPFKFFFKYTFYPNEPFKFVNILKRSNHNSPPSLDEVPIQQNNHQISASKHKDLTHLSHFLALQNREFYLKLPNSGVENLGAPSEDDMAPTWDTTDEDFYKALDEKYGVK